MQRRIPPPRASARARPTRRWTLVAIAAALASGAACGGAPPFQIDGKSLRAEAESRVRAYRPDLLEVRSFDASRGSFVRMVDGFGHPTELCLVDFLAEVTFRAPVVLGRDRVFAMLARPGASFAAVEEELTLVRLLGEGTRAVGSKATIGGSAVFERIGPSCRFSNLDRTLRFSPSRRVGDIAL